MWIWIAHEIRRRWAYALAVFIVTGVCFSRLYLGVHDVDDVLTGFALGVVGLSLFVLLLSPALAAMRRWPVVVHLAIIVVAGALLFVTWPNGEKPDTTVGILALLFGWVAGADMDVRLAPGAPVLPAWWLRILMAVAGVVVLFAFRVALTRALAVLGVEGTASGYAVAALLGFYMTGLAPLAFRALRLVR